MYSLGNKSSRDVLASGWKFRGYMGIFPKEILVN